MFSGVLSRAVDTSNMNTNMSNRGGGGSRGRGGGEEEEDEEGGLLSETVRAYVRSSTDSSFDRWRSLTLVVTWSVVTWSVVGSISHWPLDLFSSGNSARIGTRRCHPSWDVIHCLRSFLCVSVYNIFFLPLTNARPLTTTAYTSTRTIAKLEHVHKLSEERNELCYLFFIWLKCLCS